MERSQRVLTTVPMWFGLARRRHADQTITQRLPPRIIRPIGACASSPSTRKSTTAPAITLARYGRCSPDGLLSVNIATTASSLRIPICARTLCWVADGALGTSREVLSGDYYQSFSTSSPHQIWSAAMVVSPILRGMFGLQTEMEKHQISCAACSRRLDYVCDSQSPGGWRQANSKYRKTTDTLTLDAERREWGMLGRVCSSVQFAD